MSKFGDVDFNDYKTIIGKNATVQQKLEEKVKQNQRQKSK